MNNAIQTLFGRKLDSRIAGRLAAVKLRARGLARCHGVRQTVRLAVVSMASLVSEARS